MAIERSDNGKFATSRFFEDSNDIDIYVEDTGDGFEKIYNILFSKLLADQYKVGKVFPLGGRENVLKKHREELESIDRPSLFIIDGDLHLISDENEESRLGLFVLPCYCIENVLLDFNSIYKLLDEEDPSEMKDKLIVKFESEDWKHKNEQRLFDLFLEYAISFKLNPPEPTVRFPINRLVSCKRGNLDNAKFDERIKHIRMSTISNSTSVLYKEAKAKFIAKFNESDFSKLDIVSAKDYIFPLLRSRFRSTVKSQVNNIQFSVRLAMDCSISGLLSALKYIALPKINGSEKEKK